MQIYVKNSGSEFPDDLLENLRTRKIREQGLGIALLNIEERIQLMFGQQYGLLYSHIIMYNIKFLLQRKAFFFVQRHPQKMTQGVCNL